MSNHLSVYTQNQESEMKGLTRRALLGGGGRDRENVERESEMLVGEGIVV